MTTATPTMVRLLVVLATLCLIKNTFSAPVKKDSCSDGMYIALLLDASWYDSRGWASALKISKKLVDAFDVSEDGTQFAIMTFGTNPIIEMKFNKYNGTDLNSAKIKGVIDELKARGGDEHFDTFIDKALKAADKHIFASEEGMIRDKRKVAIVLTDGIQTTDRGDYTSVQIASSRHLISKGVEVYSIGISDDIDVMGLIDMASSDDNVYSGKRMLQNFKEFKIEFCKNKLQV